MVKRKMDVSPNNDNKVPEPLTAKDPVNILISPINNVSLVALMGLPASGKSTLANRISQSSVKWHTIVMSYDDYVPLNVQSQMSEKYTNVETPDNNTKISLAKSLRRKFVHCVATISRFAKEMETSRCKNVRFEKYLQDLSTSLTSGNTQLLSNECLISKVEIAMKEISLCLRNDTSVKVLVLVDDNNYYHSMRNEFYQVAKQLEIGFCVIHCKTSLSTCVHRNSARRKDLQVPQTVIVEMSLKLEEPDPLQNVCDIYCVQIDMNDQSEINLPLLENIITSSYGIVYKKIEDRTEEIERERRVCSENDVHQADLLLRKCINKKLNLASFSNTVGHINDDTKNKGGSNIKTLSKELNDRKKKVLEKLRSGEQTVFYCIEQEIEFQEEILKLFESLRQD